MSEIRSLCNSQAEKWAILIDIAITRFITKQSESEEEGYLAPSNFKTTVGELFEGGRDAGILGDLMKYLLVKFDGEMSNKGLTISGPSTLAAPRIQVLIFPDACTTMRESMSFIEPAVACFEIECNRKRKRVNDVPIETSAPSTDQRRRLTDHCRSYEV
jgi:hypothetical protein